MENQENGAGLPPLRTPMQTVSPELDRCKKLSMLPPRQTPAVSVANSTPASSISFRSNLDWSAFRSGLEGETRKRRHDELQDGGVYSSALPVAQVVEQPSPPPPLRQATTFFDVDCEGKDFEDDKMEERLEDDDNINDLIEDLTAELASDCLNLQALVGPTSADGVTPRAARGGNGTPDKSKGLAREFEMYKTRMGEELYRSEFRAQELSSQVSKLTQAKDQFAAQVNAERRSWKECIEAREEEVCTLQKALTEATVCLTEKKDDIVAEREQLEREYRQICSNLQQEGTARLVDLFRAWCKETAFPPAATKSEEKDKQQGSKIDNLPPSMQLEAAPVDQSFEDSASFDSELKAAAVSSETVVVSINQSTETDKIKPPRSKSPLTVPNVAEQLDAEPVPPTDKNALATDCPPQLEAAVVCSKITLGDFNHLTEPDKSEHLRSESTLTLPNVSEQLDAKSAVFTDKKAMVTDSPPRLTNQVARTHELAIVSPKLKTVPAGALNHDTKQTSKTIKRTLATEDKRSRPSVATKRKSVTRESRIVSKRSSIVPAKGALGRLTRPTASSSARGGSENSSGSTRVSSGQETSKTSKTRSSSGVAALKGATKHSVGRASSSTTRRSGLAPLRKIGSSIPSSASSKRSRLTETNVRKPRNRLAAVSKSKKPSRLTANKDMSRQIKKPGSINTLVHDEDGNTAAKVSPKDLVKNVLKSMTPEETKKPTQKSTPPIYPTEDINLTPTESPSRDVNGKFESLFLDWSTTKKTPHRRQKDQSLASLSFSSIKKKLKTPKTDKKDVSGSFTIHRGRTTPLGSSRYSSSFTPLMVRNVVMDVLSPEELLLSPPPPPKRKTQASVQEAVKVQAVVRGWLVRLSFRMRSKRAVKIQSAVRKWASVIMLQKIANATKLIQRTFRGSSQRRRFRRQLKAAVVLQCALRGCVARGRATTVRKRNHAATHIQSFGRKIHAERLVSGLRRRAQEILQLNERHRTAGLVQNVWRSYHARSSYIEMLCASFIIQSFWRGVADRKKVQSNRTNHAARKIQTIWRSISARSSYIETLRVLTVVQSFWRGSSSRRMLQDRQQAALMVQRAWRGYYGQSEYIQLICSTCILQSFWRGVAERKKTKSNLCVDRAIRKVQAMWRSYSARSTYIKTVCASCVVQSLWRGVSDRKKLQVKLQASIVVQSFWRGSSSRQMLQDKQQGALMVQRAWRGYYNHSEYILLVCAACILQSFWRGVATRKRTRTNSGVDRAARKVQKTWRSYSARSTYIKTVYASCVVQSLWRGVSDRKKLQVKHQAAHKMQQVWRAFATMSKEIQAICMLQSFWRGVSCRKMLKEKSRKHQAASKIQASARTVHARKQYLEQKNATFIIQGSVRVWIACRAATRMYVSRQASCKIQTFVRMVNSRKVYGTQKTAILVIQTAVRGYNKKVEMEKCQSATRIQASWRRQCCLLHRLKILTAVITIQSVARRYHCRLENNRMTQAATCVQSLWRQYQLNKLYLQRETASVAIRAVVEEIDSPPKDPSPKPSRKPLRVLEPRNPTTMFSPRKTRRGTRLAPLRPQTANTTALAMGPAPKRRRTSKTVIPVSGAENGVNVTRSANAHLEDKGKSLEELESMKVVELRSVLQAEYHMQARDIRKLRKAQLVELMMEQQQRK